MGLQIIAPSPKGADAAESFNADVVISVASVNAPPELKAQADFVCDGVADNIEIQAALDSLPVTNGTVELLGPDFTIAQTISVGHPTDPNTSSRKILDGNRAQIKWGSITGKIALVKVENSDCIVRNLRLQGSGAKGNGCGVVFGGPSATYGGRFENAVYRASAWNVQVQNCDTAFVCGVTTGTSSSGDCSIWNAYATQCKTGWLNDGFVNRWYGGLIASCDYGMVQGDIRREGRMDVFGATINNWAKVGIWIKYGSGSEFHGLWFEHTDPQSNPPAEDVIRLGVDYAVPNSPKGYAWETKMPGVINILMNDESGACVHFVTAKGTRIGTIKNNTNGAEDKFMLKNSMALADGCTDNIVDKVLIGPSNYPATYNYMTGTGDGELFVNYTPAAPGSAPFATDWQSVRLRTKAGDWSDADFVFPPPIGTIALNSLTGQVQSKGASGWALGDSGKTSVLSVAANNTPGPIKAMANYICDGVSDQTEIQAAIDFAIAQGYSCVELMSGQFNVTDEIDYGSGLWIRGQGPSTVIRQANDSAALSNIFTAKTGGATRSTISDLTIDGNRLGNPDAESVGIRVPATSSFINVLRIRVHDMTGRGFSIYGDNCVFNLVESDHNFSGGISFENAASNNWVLLCNIHDNDQDGIYSDSESLTITNNKFRGNFDTGINVSGPTVASGQHIVQGNEVWLSKNSGINTGGGNNITIADNIVYANGRGTPASSAAGIRVRDSAGGLTGTSDGIIIKGNVVYDDIVKYPLGGATGQLYGIEIANHQGGGAPTNVHISGNDLGRNLAAGEDAVLFFRGGPATSLSGTVYFGENIGFERLGKLAPIGDYTVGKEGDTYFAINKDKALVWLEKDASDPAVTSGFNSVLEHVLGSNRRIHFTAGMYTWPIETTGEEDHKKIAGYANLHLSGEGRNTILANYRDESQPGFGNVDNEPFSFTNCPGLTIEGFRIWAMGLETGNSSSDALDLDSCPGALIRDITVEYARARGICIDGQSNGGIQSRKTRIENCTIRGIPEQLYATAIGGGGNLVADEYRYCATFVDNIVGETAPGDYFSVTVAAGQQAQIATIPIGPYYAPDPTKGVTAIRIYRWSTTQPTWRRLVELPNGTTEFLDNIANATIAANPTAPQNALSLINYAGIQILGTKNSEVIDNVIYGCDEAGIDLLHKSATAQVDGNIVRGNIIRWAYLAGGSGGGIRVCGGSNNVIDSNQIWNTGRIGSMSHGLYSVGAAGCATNGNVFVNNIIGDDQNATTPNGDQTMSRGVFFGATAPVPDRTVIANNTFGSTKSSGLSIASGTNTRVGESAKYDTFVYGKATGVTDGGTIAHNCQTNRGAAFAPSWVNVRAAGSGVIASPTAVSTTTITVALKNYDGTPAAAQDVYWEARF